MNERDQPPTPRGLFPTTAFDIASADDFPSLPMGEVPRGNRAVRLLLRIALNSDSRVVRVIACLFDKSTRNLV